MAALVLTFVGVTAGIGTVAASASTPRPAPLVLPSAGISSRPAAVAPGKLPVRTGVRSPGTKPRPGTAPHVFPPPPLAFDLDLGSSPHMPLHLTGTIGSALVVDLDTHAVLWQFWPTSVRPTASLAKVFTVMVAMDHAQSLDQQVTVPPGGEDDNPEDSVMGLQVGDTVTIRDLVDGVWLASGDDAAETLARTLVPRDQFIAEMNAKAAALGLTGTHFVNPTGVDASGHYSTAADLARLTRAFAAQHGDLLAIAEQPSVVLYATDGHPEYDLVNLNKLITWPYDGATGLKTGYTARAGGCVAATASRGGRDLVAVVLGDDVMFTDAAKLFDYGWSR